MKKYILTIVVALFCFSASAQYKVMSSINEPTEGESWNLENFTNNIALGYDINDDIMLGVQKNGDDYDLIGRYNLKNNMYFSVQMPTDSAMSAVTLGIGMSLHVCDHFYIEPNYTRKDDKGGFNVGLSYKL